MAKEKLLSLENNSEEPHFDTKKYIYIKGARVNNLKNIDVNIKRNSFTVITGLSGSGKSSLAFDTLYAEGQRMYVESLSSYARQFLGRMEKPDVDYIKGISPAIAIEQKVATKNPRSTVGTTTEIFDYLKLFFSRIGTTFSPISGNIVKKDSVSDVINFIFKQPEGSKFVILAPFVIKERRSAKKELELLLQKGYSRVYYKGEIQEIENLLNSDLEINEISIVIDRAVVKFDEENEPDEDLSFRLGDSVQTAFFEGEGECDLIFYLGNEEKYWKFIERFELDGITFEEPTVNLFSFNNPYGACKRCDGFGTILGLDPELVFPDKNLSVFEGAIAPWRSEKMSVWVKPLLKNGINFDFPVHRAIKDLTKEQYQLLWTGNSYFKGLNDFFDFVEKESYKIQYRVLLSRYRGRTVCPECLGTRIRKDASYVKVSGKSIFDLVLMPIEDALQFFETLEINEYETKISQRLVLEISNRLRFMTEVGLNYLTLNRLTSTLSGGEFQRIKLATSLGSALVGSMYVLDEPSIGLHPRDTKRLIKVLKNLRDIGNTVIVVEHEEDVILAADEIIDIGPEAGINGGELVFQGNLKDVEKIKDSNSHTINYILQKSEIELPKKIRTPKYFIKVEGASENNLKNIDVNFPLEALTVVSGVSGSGKSSLVRKILYSALMRIKGDYAIEAGKYNEITGDISRINQVELIDQNPIGKSSRSNPVTYIKAYDTIRALFSELPLSKQRAYKPAFFSFNVDGGRCDTCKGEGQQTIEMQFMADLKLTCETCHGKRFNKEILEVKFEEKNIADILDLSVDEAIEFFSKKEKSLANKLLPLQKVGLGYIKLGQSSNTLSGGEAQRVKLAFFLSKGNAEAGKTLFIFDEPTTGLHIHDTKKLLIALNALVDQGDTVIVIEHNLDVMKSADWLIDLGPEGGEKGGYLLYQGPPRGLLGIEQDNYTADHLKQKF